MTVTVRAWRADEPRGLADRGRWIADRARERDERVFGIFVRRRGGRWLWAAPAVCRGIWRLER